MSVADRKEQDQRDADEHDPLVGLTVTATNGPSGWQATGWFGWVIRRLQQWTQAKS